MTESGRIAVKTWMIIVYVGAVVGSSLLVGLLVSLVGIDSKCETNRDQTIKNLLKRESFQETNKLQNIPANNGESILKQNVKGIYGECSELNIFQNNDYWELPRLTRRIIPIHYDITVYTPIFTDDGFSGVEYITVNLTESTNVFILHTKLEYIANLDMFDKNNQSVDIKCDGYYPLNEYFVFITKQKLDLNDGPFTIQLNFIARTDLYEEGLFEINYTGGERESMLASHFEPLDARKAFPCFDEPSMKATWTISIEHPDDTIALSNSEADDDVVVQGLNGTIRTTFKKTPILPSYLIGLTVFSATDFKKVEGRSFQYDIPIRVWARKQYIDGGYADDVLQMAIDIFAEFEHLFGGDDGVREGVPEKIDLFAMPEYPDDAVGHFGLIMFRETNLLFKDATTTEYAKQQIALLMAKQFAEFWFGNIVTFKWWDELWLQEGISDFLKYKAVSDTYIDWRINEQFITEELIQVLVKDGYPSTHPVIKQIESPYDIEQLFDDVETSKVAAILKMVEYNVGDMILHSALQEYLSKFKYGNGEPNYLFQNIGNIRKWPAKEFFDRWFRQANYPSVSIILKYNSTSRTNYIEVKHDRFLNSEESIFAFDELYPSPFDWTWYIPLKCTFGRSPTDPNPVDKEFDIDTRDFKEDLGNINDRYEWVHCDEVFSGYYMLDYTRDNWESLSQAIGKNDYFEPADRANIIHNAFVSSFTEKERYSDLVNILKYLRNEKDFLPWRTVHKHVSDMIGILQYRESFLAVARFFGSMINNLEYSIDMWAPTGDHVQELLRTTILDLACKIQQKECLQNASALWSSIPDIASPDSIPPHVRPVVYNYHFQNTYNIRDWSITFLQYQITEDIQEQRRLLDALTYARIPSLLARFLESERTGGLKLIDFFEAMKDLSRNPLGREIAWNFYRSEYKDLVDEYGLDDPDLGQVLIDITYTFEDEFLFYELLKFVINNPSGASQFDRFKALEIVSTNVVWLIDKEREIIEAFSGDRIINENNFNENEIKERILAFKTKAKDMFEEFKKINNIKSIKGLGVSI